MFHTTMCRCDLSKVHTQWFTFLLAKPSYTTLYHATGIKPVGDGNGVVPASRATPDGGVTCNLRQHRYAAMVFVLCYLWC